MPLPRLYAVDGVPYLRRDTPEALPQSRYYTDFRDPRDTSKDPRGRRRREFLGTSLKAAKAKLLQLLYEAQVGGVDKPAVADGQHTLAEAQERCLADLVASGLEESTRRRYVSCDRAALARFGDALLETIGRPAVRQWFAARSRDPGPTTANRDLGRLAQVLDWAIEAGWLTTDNPARRIKKNREHARSDPFTDEEWARLEAACAADPEMRDMLVFSGETGIRQGEQLRMRFDQVRQGCLWLQGRVSKKAATKTKKGRVVPLSAEALAILKRQRMRHPNSELVWPNRAGRVWHRGNFRRYRWRPLFDAAGLPERWWHDVRHDFCSRLRQGGADLVDIADLAGHSNLATTRRYAHHYPGHLESKIASLVRPPRISVPPSGDTQNERTPE